MTEPREREPEQETPEEYLALIERTADYLALMEKCVFFIAVIASTENDSHITDIEDDLQAGVLGLYNETKNFLIKHGGMEE